MQDARAKRRHIDGGYISSLAKQETAAATTTAVPKSESVGSRTWSENWPRGEEANQSDNTISHSITHNGDETEAGSAHTFVSRKLPDLEERLQMGYYLPDCLCRAYEMQGKTGKLFPWQAECLATGKVLEGQSIVYCAPTSAGKSLVSEILMLRCLIQRRKTTMLVLPFVAICTEKAYQLEQLLKPLGKHIKRFYGTHSSRFIFTEKTGILVCTIEKANLLVNRMIEENLLQHLGVVVVDELHMVNDTHRGYVLELLLTKLRYNCHKKQDLDLQIVGMSATMPNGHEIAQWVGAELYTTETRPVPLKQYLKIGSTIHDEEGKEVRKLESCFNDGQDPDHVACLAKETIDSRHSVLIFCCSKKACEHCAQNIASLLTIPYDQKPGTDINRESLVDELKSLAVGYHPILAEVILKGVAFHHAGLSSEERSLVEIAYKNGVVSILTATSTLAAGVNLPARRVIFKEPYVGLSTNVLDATRYRQMAGRAGRAGIDEVGEAFLLESKYVPREKLQKLIQADAHSVESCLLNEQNGLTRLLLEVISSRAVKTGKDVERLIQSTLLAHGKDPSSKLDVAAKDSLKWLASQQLIYWEPADRFNNHKGRWSCNALGTAIVSSGMHPEECASVKMDLQTAMQHLVLASDLHLAFLVTPYNIDMELDWNRFYFMFNSLSPTETSIAELVGVSMVFVQGMYIGVKDKDTQNERIARRFYAALVLQEVINEVPLTEICQRFDVTRGMVETLQEKALRYAAMTATFCGSLGWVPLKAMISEFQKRIYGGARPEIVHLTEIPYVHSNRARLLYRAGFRTVESIAVTESIEKVAKTLFPDREGPANPRNLGIARKLVYNAKLLLRGHLQKMEEESKTAAEIVGKEALEATEAPLDRFTHDIESFTHRDTSEEVVPVVNEAELSSNLRRLSFQPMPFLNTEGIVLLQMESEVKSLLEHFKSSNISHVGLSFHSNGVAISWSQELVVYISFSELDAGSRKEQLVLDFLQLETLHKSVFQAPQKVPWLPEGSISCRSNPFLLDVKTAGNLLGSQEDSLEALFRVFGCMEDYNTMVDYMTRASEETCSRFHVFAPCLQATLTHFISRLLCEKLQEMKMWELYIKIENHVVHILDGSDEAGVLLDRTLLEDHLKKVQSRLQELKEIFCMLDVADIDPESDEDVKKAMEKMLQLPEVELDERKLRPLQAEHPFPAAILEYRTLRKSCDNFIQILKSHPSNRMRLRAQEIFEMRYMRSNWQSLQALPIQEISLSHGYVWMSTKDAPTLNLLHCLIPREDSVLVVGELVNLELTLFAHFSRVQEFCEVIGQKMREPYQAIAALWLKGSTEVKKHVTNGELCYCKTFIRGFLEGASPQLIAARLRLRKERIQDTYRGFLERFKNVQHWLRKLMAEVQQTSGVQTLHQRHLPIEEGMELAEMERLVVRSIIHGSISDILKLAVIETMHKVSHHLRTEARLYLQEKHLIVMEVQESRLREGAQLLRVSLEQSLAIQMPALVQIQVGKAWGKLENFSTS